MLCPLSLLCLWPNIKANSTHQGKRTFCKVISFPARCPYANHRPGPYANHRPGLAQKTTYVAGCFCFSTITVEPVPEPDAGPRWGRLLFVPSPWKMQVGEPATVCLSNISGFPTYADEEPPRPKPLPKLATLRVHLTATSANRLLHGLRSLQGGPAKTKRRKAVCAHSPPPARLLRTPWPLARSPPNQLFTLSMALEIAPQLKARHSH